MSQPPIEPFDQAQRDAIVAAVADLAPLRQGFRHAELEHSWPHSYGFTLADLRAMAALQQLIFTHHFSSHRKFSGIFIVAAKRLLIGVLGRLLKISLVRQVELNQHAWNLALTVHHLQKRVDHLEAAVLAKAAKP